MFRLFHLLSRLEYTGEREKNGVNWHKRRKYRVLYCVVLYIILSMCIGVRCRYFRSEIRYTRNCDWDWNESTHGQVILPFVLSSLRFVSTVLLAFYHYHCFVTSIFSETFIGWCWKFGHSAAAPNIQTIRIAYFTQRCSAYCFFLDFFFNTYLLFRQSVCKS